MRSPAKVNIFALPEKAEGLLIKRCNVFAFVVLAALPHQSKCIVPRQHKRLDRIAFPYNTPHFLLNGRQLCLRQLCVSEIDIIIEALFCRRSKGKSRLRVQPLDRLCQNVRRGVPQNRYLLLHRAYGYCSVSVDDFHVFVSSFLFLKFIQ